MKKGNSLKRYDTVFAAFALVLGMLMGWMAYDLSGYGLVGVLIGNIGLWVFASALLAFHSQSGLGAAINTFVYFAGVIGFYYLHVMFAGGEVGLWTFIRPLVWAVIGAIIGFLVWYAGAKEWLGAICAAIPISLLIAESYPLIHGLQWALVFDVVCAVILYLLLCNGKLQRLMALPCIIVLVVALVYFDAFGRIFGGWI
ncbi:MAG: hypothetical protein IKU44_04070 [Firmicutes bacterium]|nr:hypothetical protein [Bacillota bacterium]